MPFLAHRVTFVCEANICRSPLMAYTFEAGEDPLPGAWAVTSRGVNVVEERRGMCGLSASLIKDEWGGPEFVQAQQATPMTAVHLDAQDMILVAGRAERAEVARISPGTRSRTFTLREAIALGDESVTSAEFDVQAEEGDGGRSLFNRYVEILNRRRSYITLPRAGAPRLWRRSVPDPLDILDAHHLGRKEHLEMLQSLREDARALRSQLSRFLAPEPR